MFDCRQMAAAIVSVVCCTQLVLPGLAQTTVLTGKASKTTTIRSLQVQQPRYDYHAPQKVYVQRPVTRTVYVQDNRTFFQRHPKVKAATVGAGVGTAAGAITGLVSGRGVVRGAAIGAGTGAGVGLIHSSRTMKRHPIIKDTAMGSLAGLGIGAAASHGSRRAFQGAGVGAAVGLGVGLLKHGLK
jgi:hypothetical protein